MSESRIKALEAAVAALRERNEILEEDRKLLGRRVADLDGQLLRLQRELVKRPPSTPTAPADAAPATTDVVPHAGSRGRALGSLRRSRRRTDQQSQPPSSPSSPAPVATSPPPPATRSEIGTATSVTTDVTQPASAAPRTSRLRVLGVLDTMSAECFGESVDLTLPSPQDAVDAIRHGEFDLVLVESAWQGNGGSWQYHVGSYATEEHRGIPALRGLIDGAKKQGVPTAFWNKEDPVHFGKFAEAARLFDAVFTTDSDRIGAYYALKGCAQVVGSLQFAAQPSLHNPVGGHDRLDSPVFAGTFYGNRHVARQGSLKMLLEAAKPYGLVIYDRQHGTGMADYDFPETVADCVVGSVPYSELVHEYRRHKVFLNTNSVTESPTMFSRRVFELLACGTPVVSTPSRGMEETFGHLVDSVSTPQEAAKALERLITDGSYWQRRSRDGIREAMLHHTYAHRLGQIARATGVRAPEAGPSVALVCLSAADISFVVEAGAALTGVREVAVPADTSGAAVASLLRETPVTSVVRFDSAPGDDGKSMAAASHRVSTEWVVSVPDLRGHAPTVVADLAIATMFGGQDRVVARPGTAFDDAFQVITTGPGELDARRAADVARGVDHDRALLAWA